MSAPKFTPGPWAYSVAPCGYIYAITQSANDCIRVETKNEANVRLIAAAPELYRAGKRVTDAFRAMSAAVGIVAIRDARIECESAMLDLDAALAKAVRP